MQKAKFSSIVSTFVACFLLWLVITWSVDAQELLIGAITSLAVAVFSARFFIHDNPAHFFNPFRFLALIFYCLVIFMTELVEANMNVAKRAFTGNVNPGIVKIPVDIQSEYGQAMLANSITLTPGTITMDIVEEDGQTYYYIHWIDVAAYGKDAGIEIKGTLEKWVGRIWS